MRLPCLAPRPGKPSTRRRRVLRRPASRSPTPDSRERGPVARKRTAGPLPDIAMRAGRPRSQEADSRFRGNGEGGRGARVCRLRRALGAVEGNRDFLRHWKRGILGARASRPHRSFPREQDLAEAGTGPASWERGRPARKRAGGPPYGDAGRRPALPGSCRRLVPAPPGRGLAPLKDGLPPLPRYPPDGPGDDPGERARSPSTEQALRGRRTDGRRRRPLRPRQGWQARSRQARHPGTMSSPWRGHPWSPHAS